MDQERVLSDQTVIIREGRISEIGAASSIEVPVGATQIDGTGKYLIPALADMHVHLLGKTFGETMNSMLPSEAQIPTENMDFSKFVFPYVANGVATVQVMTALPEHIAFRDQINRTCDNITPRGGSRRVTGPTRQLDNGMLHRRASRWGQHGKLNGR